MTAALTLTAEFTADSTGLTAEAANVERSMDGIATEADAAKARLDALGNSLGAHSAAAKAAAKDLGGLSAQTKLTSFQTQQLSYQLNDIAVSLISGQSPFTVLVQQGSQIAPLFGGIRGTLSTLASVLTPVRLAAGGVTAAVIAGAMAWSDYNASVSEVRSAATGLGASIGATAGELESIARAGAAAGAVSIASARAMEAQFLRTGTIGTSAYTGLIAIAKRFGEVIGASSDEAAAELAKIFADPASGATRLSSQLHLIDGATARYVQRLSDQNRGEKARLALLGALQVRLADTSVAVGGLAAMWDRVAKAASNAWDFMGRAIDGTATSVGNMGAYATGKPMTSPDASALGAMVGAGIKGTKPKPDDAEEAKRRAAADAAGSKAVGIAANSPAVADERRRRALEQDSRALRAGLDAGLLGNERSDAASALDAKTRALATYMTATERAQALATVDIALQQAQDPLTRANLAARRQEIELAGQEISSAEARISIEDARTKALGESLAGYQARTTALQQDAAAQRAANTALQSGRASAADVERQLRIETELRPLTTAYAKAEGQAKVELGRIIAGLRAAYAALADEEKRAQALSMIAAQDDRVTRLRAEIGLVWQNTAARNRALAVLQAEQDMRRAGIDLASTDAERIRVNAVLEADLTTNLDRQRDAYQTLADFGSGALDNLSQAIAENGLSWQTLQTTVNSIVGDLLQTMLKLAVLNPVKNMMFGTNLGTLSDVMTGLGARTAGNDDRVSANDNRPASRPSAVDLSAATATAAKELPKAVRDLSDIVSGYARDYGVDPRLALAVMAQESRGNQNAVSPAGATGLMQLMPGTARDLGVNPYDATDNIRGGVKYLSQLSDRYGGDTTRMLAAYNWGPARVDRWAGDVGRLPGETQDYLKNVSGYMAGQGGGGLERSATAASAAVDGMARSAAAASAGLDTVGRGAGQTATSLTTSAGGVGQAGEALKGAAETTVQKAETSFGDFGAGLGKLGEGFLGSIGSVLQSILGSIGGGKGGAGGLLGGLFSMLGGIFGGAHAAGGLISGPGTGTSDSILARVSTGEFVVRASATAQHLPLLQAINSGRLAGYAEGGLVGATLGATLPTTNDNRAFAAAAGAAAAGPTVSFVTHVTVGDNASANSEEIQRRIDESNAKLYQRIRAETPGLVMAAQRANRFRSGS